MLLLLHWNLSVAVTQTGAKGIEPTWFSSTCCIIVRKCSVSTHRIASTVNGRLVSINWCLSLIHVCNKGWTVWTTLSYAVCMNSSGPKRALSLMIIIHLNVIQGVFLLSHLVVALIIYELLLDHLLAFWAQRHAFLPCLSCLALYYSVAVIFLT